MIAGGRPTTAKAPDGWQAWREEVVNRPPALEFSGTVPYRQGWTLLVPDGSGLYLLHDLRGFLYIGRAQDLQARYQQHYWTTHNRALRTALRKPLGETKFSWICCDPMAAVVHERELVRSLQPLCNVIRFTS